MTECTCPICGGTTVFAIDIEYIDKVGHCPACQLETVIGTIIGEEREHDRSSNRTNTE